jgi:predicted dehydrogenase/nucleoside-diphosphate-sugar epimerase
MAQNHLRAIRSLDDASVVAIVDPNPQARQLLEALEPSARSVASIQELLGAGQIDVMHICTPPDTHADLAEQALAARCHVYVEKPFAESSQQARAILERAHQTGRLVCAGHQLLFESPARALAALLPAIGKVVHIESFFAFRPVRRAPGGRVPMRSDLQLLDVLPHPTYLLLDILERCAAGATSMTALDVSDTGTVHALLRRGDVTGTLVVTLEGRPVESYVRVTGTNGTLVADFVRGTVQRQFGPGSSGLDKALAPYSVARQLLTGTTGALARRIAKGQTAYAGLSALIETFYSAIREHGPSPISAQSILATTGICEAVAARLTLRRDAVTPSRVPRPNKDPVVLTGGTGFLGKAVAEALVAAGEHVRVIARREPASWERVTGVEYRVADLGAPVMPSLLEGARLVIHAAAETAGGWSEHQRNSIDATTNVLRAAAEAGVRDFVHVSSLAVLAGRRLVDEDTPLAPDPRSRGPYVWGKLESERLAVSLGTELGLRVRIVRPGALVDHEAFEPPGRLGKLLGNTFVAVGSPRQRLGVVDVRLSARVFAWLAQHPDEALDRLNLVTPGLVTKRALIEQLRRRNPDLTVIWLPTPLLHVMSWLAIIAQKVVHPKRPALMLSKIFSVDKYDTSRVATMVARVERDVSQSFALA